jgi:hypothetical protein
MSRSARASVTMKTLVYEGSLVGATFAALDTTPLDMWLKNPSLAALGDEMARPIYFRPHRTAGDNTTNYTVTLVLRRSYR